MEHKPLIITSLFLALSGSVVGVQAQTCTPTAVTPYIKVAGVWNQTATASVNAGNQIVLGPQPTRGGSWQWNGGCGTSGTAREQTITPSASCTATTVYTNSCGAKTSKDFTIKVPLYPSYNTNPIAPDAAGMSSNAMQLAAKIKLGTNIGNTMEAYGCTPASETCWGRPMVSAAYVKLVKDSGFDAIRLPVSWDQYADQKTGKISDAWLARVKQVVQYAVDNGLYVVVNIHWDGGWLEKNITADKQEAVNAKQKAYWEQIATALRDFDEHVLFASANEPDAPDAAATAILESYHQTFVNAVRSTGGKNAYRVLILQAPQTNIDKAADIWNVMPTDTVAGRQMAEVHFYPFSWSIQEKDESYATMFYYWGNGFHSTTDTTRNSTREEEPYVDAEFARMKAKFVDHGIPVVLGEFEAMYRTQLTGDNLALHRASRAYYSQYVAQAALANGMLPFYWEIGSEVDLFNRSTPAVNDPQILDSLLAGAGKGVVLSARPHSWTLDSGAGDTSTGSNMQFNLNLAGATASYTFANPVNLNGATWKMVLNFDQTFVSSRNGGMDSILQFYAYSANWAASEFKCWTANQTLVADQDTEFTCSAFGLQNAVGVGLQFPKAGGSVTVKRAAIKFAQ